MRAMSGTSPFLKPSYKTNESDILTTTITPVYDPDGNLTNDGRFELVYDAENRLISATPLDTASALKKVEFAYDFMSRRVRKVVSTHDGSAWNQEKEILFVYDGWNLIREQTTTGGTTTTEYYVWGLDLSGSLQGAGGVGGLLSKTNSLTSKNLPVYL